MSWLILTIAWCIVFGPYAIIYKLTQKKPQAVTTYWIDTNPDQDLRHQF